MDARARRTLVQVQGKPTTTTTGARSDYIRSFSHGTTKTNSNSSSRISKYLPVSYFSVESLLVLVCLTASLLILPLVLPPLPPPPLMMLLLPIGIFAVLMILAFMPSHAPNITSSSYV